MSQHPPVPRLDLAPKLKRPLSLWNPLDYLRLLYWVFYFPQALRWYVDTFAGGYVPPGEMNWRKGWELLQQNPIQRNLLLQGLILTVITPLISGQLLHNLGIAIDWLGVAGGVAFGVAFGVVFGVASLRPESWLMGLPLNLKSLSNGNWLLSRVTLLPLPRLAWRLQNWLLQDWETGLQIVNQLLAYTLQFVPVVQAVNRVLAITPSDEIIWRVSRLAEAPFDWHLVRFASASLSNSLISENLEQLWFLPWRQRWQEGLMTDTQLNTPARAAAAGFWYLHKKQPRKAMEAFAEVRSLLYGEEMFTLAQTLTFFKYTNKPATIAALKLPTFPNEPLLRPTTWQALLSLRRVIEDVQTVERSVSRSARAFALSRALGELTNILNHTEDLPQAEQGLIIDIAETWKQALLSVAGEVGEISITQPVSNPYVVGDPVEGNLFVGREDVMRDLRELWVTGHQVQSVVLYGHRRMGKTSILRNAANRLGSGVKVAYVNLLEVGDASLGVAEVLMAMSDAISEVMQFPPPANEELLNLPLPTFRRYLKQVEEKLEGKGLIIVLDEFEKIENLIEAGKIPKDFMGFLRGLVQKSSQIAFTFAGLHTLEEMAGDYFQPFYASVIPIKVSFMELGATHEILANPAIGDFPLDYTIEALDKIYGLTHGQPYLVQLVGFQLVRRYNDYVFQQGRSRNLVFTVEDVEAVVNDPEFFKRGRYYFDGVWGQAARGASGQQAIIRAIAPHPQGLTMDALANYTGSDMTTLQEALKSLKRHDVVKETDGSLRITVELFRRWVLRS
ncbi:MAG: ATP-binding protein [Stigonema ocellatum SAG 48.90 = DSM 106950]|nr:ATP-binding protein [Stigonema ocellatum SAG 48.90 = DSM 106950]